MLKQIQSGENGKRIWSHCSDYKYDSGLDYSLTTRSTYPEWIKFFYVKPTKREKKLYHHENLFRHVVNLPKYKMFELSWFNGRTDEVERILKNLLLYKKIKTSDRLNKAIDIIFKNFYEFEKDWFDQYKERLINE